MLLKDPVVNIKANLLEEKDHHVQNLLETEPIGIHSESYIIFHKLLVASTQKEIMRKFTVKLG